MDRVNEVRERIGAVLDPHLPFGIGELGMLESGAPTADGGLEVVVNLPCQHCPGLEAMREEIIGSGRSAGVTGAIRVSFHGTTEWRPQHISEPVQQALRAFGIQVVRLPESTRETTCASG